MAKKFKKEASTSDGAGGYLTPNAFSDDEKEKDKDLKRQGYDVKKKSVWEK